MRLIDFFQKGGVVPTLSGRKSYIWDRLKGSGLSDLHASAVLGNLLQENDSLDPDRSNSQGSGAYGIAQWLGKGRLGKLKSLYPDTYDTLETQTTFLIDEILDSSFISNSWLSTENYNSFINTSSLEQATDLFADKFERMGALEKNLTKRVKNARDVYRQFSGASLREDVSTPTINADDYRENREYIPSVFVSNGSMPSLNNKGNYGEHYEEEEVISQKQRELVERDNKRRILLENIPLLQPIKRKTDNLQFQTI